MKAGAEYDPSILIKTYSGPKLPILIDQGTHDKFLHTELLPDKLKVAAGEVNYPLNIRMQPGYDHSYYFITTFIHEHIEHHAWSLGLKKRL